jgi:hypothetical protein
VVPPPPLPLTISPTETPPASSTPSLTTTNTLAFTLHFLRRLSVSVFCPRWCLQVLEWSYFSIGNTVVYRIETVGAVINILRCYLCWWFFVEFMVRFTNHLPLPSSSPYASRYRTTDQRGCGAQVRDLPMRHKIAHSHGGPVHPPFLPFPLRFSLKFGQ